MESPPAELGGMEVESLERLAPDVLRMGLEDGSRVALRPSGTEAKFKYYCEAYEPVVDGEQPSHSARRASARLGPVVAELRRRLS